MRWVNRKPSRRGAPLIGALPLAGLALAYVIAAAIRHADNPADKLLPLPGAMAEAMALLLFVPDPLSGELLFWADTAASLWRLGVGLAIATSMTLLVGLLVGVLPPVKATFGPLLTAIAVIPPIAVLPVLFIVFGLGEVAKVALIVVGVAPFMIRDVAGHVAALPREQVVKALTLGANSWGVMLRVALPQALPRLIAALRLSLGPAWVFLISAEAIAADVGLGYRIFLVRRYLAMDVILPYVAWIALLAVVLDFALFQLSRRLSGWAHAGAQ
jgi:NitT/TauT family transport system permease protein